MEPIPYDSIVRRLPYGLCIVDSKGEILSTNAALERLLGQHVAEWRGLALTLCLEQAIPDPNQALSWTAALNQALALNETTHLNVPTKFRTGSDDGSSLSATGTVIPWQNGAECSGALVIFRDSSLERDAREAQSRFLAVLSHELGTPVANLGIAADLLANRLGTDDGLGRLVQIVRSEANHLRRLLGQLPTTLPASIESPQPRKDVVTLRPVFRRVAETFEMRDLDCEIVVEVPRDLPFVWCDGERIKEILGKLVENAIYYVPPGGQIILAAEKRDNGVVVSVSERGPDDLPGDKECISARFSFTLPCVQGLPDEEAQTEAPWNLPS
jgi:signal transduction histidine kinase